jgi:hypothetical protein
MDAPRGVHTLICPALSFTGREDVDGLLELRQATEGRIKRMSLTESFGAFGVLAEAILKAPPTGKG